MIESIKKFILTNKFTLILFIYIYIISTYPIHFLPKPTLVLGCILAIIILFFISKIKYLSYILISIFAILLSIEAIFSFIYSKSVGMDEIAILLETDAKEAKGILSMLSITIPSLIFISLSFFLSFKASKELQKLSIKYYILAISASTIILFILVVIYHGIIKLSLEDAYRDAPVATIHSLLRVYDPTIVSTSISIGLYVDNKMDYIKYSKLPKKTPEGIEFTNDKSINKIYLVIGESANRDYMSLYGYDVSKTTPFFDSLASDSNKIRAYNGIAAAPITMVAVPIILTSSTPKEHQKYFKEKSLIELANEVGFHTVWFSTQARAALMEFRGTAAISNLAQTCNQRYFIATDDPLEDFKLLGFYNSYKSNNDYDKELMIFHLSGSHIPYTDKIDKEDIRAIPNNSSITSSYEQSIHHTDRFLKILWNKIVSNDENAILIYVSDHGETVGKGHSIGEFSKVDYTIPFVVLNNRSDNVIYELTNKYLNSEFNYINNSTVYNIALETLGYSISDNLQENILTSGGYVRQGDRIMGVKELLDENQ